MPGADEVGNTDEPDKSSGLKHDASRRPDPTVAGVDDRLQARFDHAKLARFPEHMYGAGMALYRITAAPGLRNNGTVVSGENDLAGRQARSRGSQSAYTWPSLLR